MSDNMWDELEDLLSEDTKESSDKSNSGDKDSTIGEIMCSETGKQISGYDGELSVDVHFTDPVRYYTFKDIDLHFNDGKLDLEKSFKDDDYIESNINEMYPKIDVKIQSPFVEEDSFTELSLKDVSVHDEIHPLLDQHNGWATTESDIISEIDEFKETKQVSFYELWLPSIEGKYRGYMQINFKDIYTNDDLLKAVIDEALLNFDWYYSAEETVKQIFVDNFGYSTQNYPAIQKNTNVDEIDHYTLVQETGYLTRRGSYDDIQLLFENFPHELDLNELNKEIESDEWMQSKGFKNLKDLIEGEYNDDWSKNLKEYLSSKIS